MDFNMIWKGTCEAPEDQRIPENRELKMRDDKQQNVNFALRLPVP
jgi:hypothetical protein